ncbi:DNA-binding transcriptional regulator, LysR family [Modestobacter sp. DSM 44400]|uniref:LysR family transcriptional regulator n=1 Tax=Modestobacter sp. DSM 44400 TaxID=1550230 RepID=UPI00089B440E|nr:LysR family transcriptional regulator [Modestobacter sp. DSM 44400]SDX90068.1 DNA-binding transcriptional regulator, LysR family [Modestobacter sp. DSM 44400]
MVRADDTVILLEVARCGTLLGAAAALGVDHSTVSRRLTALEKDLGATVVIRSAQGCRLTDLGREVAEAAERIEEALADVRGHAQNPTGSSRLTGLLQVSSSEAFGVHFVAPVLARLQHQHPGLRVELVIATRPLLQTVGADIEIVVGQPGAGQNNAVPLAEYTMGMYASPEYLQRRGTPHSPGELRDHTLVFYIEPLMRITDLHIIERHFSGCTIGFASTNVFAHVEATKAGSGIGLLPAFLGDREPGLNRLFADEVSISLDYVASMAARVMRRPAAQLVMAELGREVARRRSELRGRAAS